MLCAAFASASPRFHVRILLAQNLKGFSHSSIFIGASLWRHIFYIALAVVVRLQLVRQSIFLAFLPLAFGNRRERHREREREKMMIFVSPPPLALYTIHLTSSFNHNLDLTTKKYAFARLVSALCQNLLSLINLPSILGALLCVRNG
jgi:hypothetical protein